MSPTFIPGIYNYCDRWCERCRFSERCLVHAEHNYREALATGLAAENPYDLLERESPATPEGEAFMEDVLRAQASMTEADLAAFEREERAANDRRDRDPLTTLAQGLSRALWHWSSAYTPPAGDALIAEAREMIAHYGIMLDAKVKRALGGYYRALLHGEEDDDALATARLTLTIAVRLRSAVELLALTYPSDAVLRGAFADLPVLESMLRARFPGAESAASPTLDDGADAD